MPPQLKPFDPEDFLESVAACGPQLTSQHKGNWAALYRGAFVSRICFDKTNVSDVLSMIPP